MKLRKCVRCPPDDNEWPLNCFTFRGSAFWNICNSCWAEHYVRIYVRCTGCNRPQNIWRLRENALKTYTCRRCNMRINVFHGQYRFLSNFFPCHIVHEGELYRSVEHAYQASKTKRPTEKKFVRDATTAGESKRRGRRVTMRTDWDGIKVDVMRQLLREKFRNTNLRRQLLNTGDVFLEEGNYWHDNFWGNCGCDRCKNIEGLNWLGRLLMEIRSEAAS